MTPWMVSLGASATQTAVEWTVLIGIVVIALGMVGCVFRLLRGPHVADRAMAVDTLAIQLIGLVVLLGYHIQTQSFVDGILVLSLLGFAGTVAMAQYIARPHLRRDRPSSTHDPSGQENA